MLDTEAVTLRNTLPWLLMFSCITVARIHEAEVVGVATPLLVGVSTVDVFFGSVLISKVTYVVKKSVTDITASFSMQSVSYWTVVDQADMHHRLEDPILYSIWLVK